MTTPFVHSCGCSALSPCPIGQSLLVAKRFGPLTFHLSSTYTAAKRGNRYDPRRPPMLADPCWEKESDPLLAFLQGGRRDWIALESWAHQNGIGGCRLREQLAFLESRHLAKTVWLRAALKSDRESNRCAWVAA